MHDAGLIFTLAGGFTAALVLGYFTQRIGLSPIAGYLIAGLAVGPHTPGFVASQAYAQELAEIGVILLMFGVGLQFHIEELVAVRRVALPGALIGMIVSASLGAAAAHTFGWPWLAAAVFGLTLSVASTVVLVRVLSDTRQLHTRTGHIAVGWLVVEDILTVLVLVLLPTLAGSLQIGTVVAGAALAMGKLAALVVLAVPLGRYVVPQVLDRVAATRSRELFTLTILVLALGIATGAAAGFGVSVALGAFIAGLVVGRSDYSVRAAGDALPMRDAFAVLFFVSVGMLLDPVQLLDQGGLLLAALAIVLFAKPLAAMVMLRVLRYPLRTALTVPAALAQIGEFSFILANLGRELQLLPAAAINVVVAVSIVSIVANPIGARLIPRVERWLTARGVRGDGVGQDQEPAASSLDPADRAVVIGYGPTGRTVTRLLRENGIAPTVVELNMDTVRALRQQGASAVYGDARMLDTLVGAGVRHAASLIISGASADSPEVVRHALDLNPAIKVLARAAYVRDVPPLRRAGVTEVFSGEGEVALAMTEAVLRRLGASPDQIDRERDRVRRELG
jgi:monovalent cation:H+ antiporter-2, CPA2 family